MHASDVHPKCKGIYAANPLLKYQLAASLLCFSSGHLSSRMPAFSLTIIGLCASLTVAVPLYNTSDTSPAASPGSDLGSRSILTGMDTGLPKLTFDAGGQFKVCADGKPSGLSILH